MLVTVRETLREHITIQAPASNALFSQHSQTRSRDFLQVARLHNVIKRAAPYQQSLGQARVHVPANQGPRGASADLSLSNDASTAGLDIGLNNFD